MDHFIETVRRYPCLWNTAAIEYRDQELKDAAWAEVMRETDLPSVKEVKLKWKKLRDSYRDALKRQSELQSREPGAPCKKNYPWKYSGQMQFLQPYMGNRRKAPGAAAAPGPPARNGSAPGAGACSDASESESEPEPAPAPKRRAAERPGPAARPPEYPGPRRARGPPEAPPAPDPLDIFFNSMCQATKRLPFHTQIKIKRSLFEAVTQAEEALLAEQQHSYAGLWARAGASSSASSEPDLKPC